MTTLKRRKSLHVAQACVTRCSCSCSYTRRTLYRRHGCMNEIYDGRCNGISDRPRSTPRKSNLGQFFTRETGTLVQFAVPSACAGPELKDFASCEVGKSYPAPLDGWLVSRHRGVFVQLRSGTLLLLCHSSRSLSPFILLNGVELPTNRRLWHSHWIAAS